MNSEDITKIIEKELGSYYYEEPEPGNTHGKARSKEKVLSFITKLKKALVTPYLQKFRLSETGEHFNTEVFEEYWVVAVDSGYIQWYDPSNQEYRLALKA